MACYVVTYDLNKETVRPNIVSDIQDFDGWARLSESSYAITTDKSVDAVYELLLPNLDENDSLYVISLSKPYSGQGSEEVNKWLADSLP